MPAATPAHVLFLGVEEVGVVAGEQLGDDECLNINIFWSLAHARVVITDWKEDYNHRRRHSSLGYQAPADYAAACTHR